MTTYYYDKFYDNETNEYAYRKSTSLLTTEMVKNLSQDLNSLKELMFADQLVSRVETALVSVSDACTVVVYCNCSGDQQVQVFNYIPPAVTLLILSCE